MVAMNRRNANGVPASQDSVSIHPLGSNANVLLTSVFGPYARDDEYGSRQLNPMELYHNQVTRAQGGFSLRMFHRSFGLMLLQANIDAPCALLDFPTLERFIDEVRDGEYDVIGISSILPNVGKVRKMCEIVREHAPRATIVVGGHVANKPDLAEVIDTDHVVRGDGVAWFRAFLGQSTSAPIRHPAAYSAFGARTLGLTQRDRPGDVAAMVLPSVGCPVGCNFCSTSAMFGGKGKYTNFYDTGDELFEIMCGLEEKLRVHSFFIMDENFLLHRQRALRLLELMEEHDKAWSLMVFSSGRVLKSYRIDQLLGLGLSWVWLGLEGETTQYKKVDGIDTRKLVKTLQSHGIRVLGSTIIGLEHHTVDGMDRVIDHAVHHATDFHQFMLYTPIPGTPLYEQHRRQGDLLSDEDCPPADTHGQSRFNYRHRNITNGEETGLLLRAFERDFEVNGPSLTRMVRTMLTGWKCHKNNPDERVRRRVRAESKPLRTTYAGLVWAARRWFRHDARLVVQLDALLHELYLEFGMVTRIAAPLVGLVGYLSLKSEEHRLANGWTYDPKTAYEKNPRAKALEVGPSVQPAAAPQAEWVSCAPTPERSGKRRVTPPSPHGARTAATLSGQAPHASSMSKARV